MQASWFGSRLRYMKVWLVRTSKDCQAAGRTVDKGEGAAWYGAWGSPVAPSMGGARGKSSAAIMKSLLTADHGSMQRRLGLVDVSLTTRALIGHHAEREGWEIQPCLGGGFVTIVRC